jgi:hypothetical protein
MKPTHWSTPIIGIRPRAPCRLWHLGPAARFVKNAALGSWNWLALTVRTHSPGAAHHKRPKCRRTEAFFCVSLDVEPWGPVDIQLVAAVRAVGQAPKLGSCHSRARESSRQPIAHSRAISPTRWSGVAPCVEKYLGQDCTTSTASEHRV